MKPVLIAKCSSTPPQRRPRAPQRHLEEHEQIALLAWAANVMVDIGNGERIRLGDVMYAIPNGTYLGGSDKARQFQMARLKRAGLKPGVFDLLITLPRGEWHALWCEMKKPRDEFSGPAAVRSAVSEEQRAFGTLQQRLGYRTVVCYGYDEARRAIEHYVSGRDIVMEEGGS